MRILALAVGALIASQLLSGTAEAVEYPWCRQSSDGGTNCGFSSRQQCGGGMGCYENPFYTAPTARPTGSKRRRA
jgi:hypothetical protein